MNICKYKDIFGVPKKGIHSYRIFNIAIVDLLLTLLVAYAFTYIEIFQYSTNRLYNFIIISIVLILISIIIHKLFCVNTSLTKMLIR